MPLALSPEEFSAITSMVAPLPYARRSDFLHQLVAELQTVSGPRSPATVKAIGQRLQIRFLGVAVVGDEDQD